MDVKAKVQDWVNLQAGMKTASDAGDTHTEQSYCAAAAEIERQLREAGHEIRDLVCVAAAASDELRSHTFFIDRTADD